MFGYQLVTRLTSPGYEVWKDWLEHYLGSGMKLGWTEELMKWLPTKLCAWALNAVGDLPRVFWRWAPERQALALTETLYQFDIQLSDNPFFMSEATYCLLEGKRESRRIL